MRLEFPPLDPPFLALAATVIVAGVARGMSGFGSGMIIAPVAAAIYGPQVAVPMLAILETLPTIPVTVPALPLVRWREVLPVTAGLAALLPAGVYVLSHSDAETLRWIICAAILICAAVLWTGWRYRGPRGLPVSFGVGGLSGLLSGIASIPGPPVIFYWLTSDLATKAVRANLLAFFLLGDFLSIASFWVAGLFKPGVIGIGIAAMPFYFAALLVGSRLHGLASDRTYRRVTFGLIVLSAVLALPLIQRMIAMLAPALDAGLPAK
jgi:uncharacterized membrane protein YfcA